MIAIETNGIINVNIASTESNSSTTFSYLFLALQILFEDSKEASSLS